MFKRIMLAIDSSKVSRLALKKAIDLAKEQKAKLCIIHIIDYSPLIVNGEGIDFEALRESIQTEGQAILNHAILKAKKSRIKVESKLIEQTTITLTTNIAHLVIKTAEKWRASLLVIGTHAFSGVSRFVLGSIADEVIHNTSIPLLLIREKKGGQ
jgi:nucleotide-binding universal stress UspA family protein